MYGQVHFTSLLLKQLMEGRGVFWFRVSEGESIVKAQAWQRHGSRWSGHKPERSDHQLHTVESKLEVGLGYKLFCKSFPSAVP